MIYKSWKYKVAENWLIIQKMSSTVITIDMRKQTLTV